MNMDGRPEPRRAERLGSIRASGGGSAGGSGHARRIVFLGPPGAGKGTQAVRLAERRQLPHVATGDIFRAAVRDGTPLGREAKRYMDEGKLVPDQVTVGIVRERLEKADCARGFVLDGFPRTLAQARALDELLAGMNRPLERVVPMVVDDDVLVRRSTGRRVCPRCGATYHVDSRPPRQPGRCDACGAALVQRDDDSEATVRRRLAVYHEQTEPLVAYYRDQGKLRDVDGQRSVEEVAAAVEQAVGDAAEA